MSDGEEEAYGDPHNVLDESDSDYDAPIVATKERGYNKKNKIILDSDSEEDKKTWSNYMIHRFLSMDYDFVEAIADLQPLTQTMEPKFFYLLLLGVIPKGTPYLQIIPFKRDDWEAEYIHHSPTEIHNRTIENSNKFRTVEGGVYKKYFWSKRKYK